MSKMNKPELKVDVLIIGAGPAGLIAAMWMARRGIITRVVEQRPDALRVGGADGLHPRSMEMFESFGFDQEVTQLWEPTTDWTLWWRDATGYLGRKERGPNPLPVRTRWGMGVLQQGVIESIIKRHITAGSSIAVDYDITPCSFYINEKEVNDPDAYPCLLRLRREPNGKSENGCQEEEAIRAKYVIGADGATSWTRKQLGFTMDGSRTQSVWGVADLVVVSDFPDVRTATTINSYAEGGLFFIRRERHLTRFYVQLSQGKEKEELLRESVTEHTIIAKLQQMLRPYTLTVKYCEWWSAYTIAHYLSSGMTKDGRVFLVGDAVHSHSPLVGLGMNVSMQDSYNLGWKLAGVVRKELDPRILATFETERRPIAEELIAADRFHLQVFDTEKGAEPAWMREREAELLPFLMGFSVHYKDPILTVSNPARIEAKEQQPDDIVPGKRFPQIYVSNHATAKTYSIQSLLKSDCSFHIVVFAGDISQRNELEQLNAFGAALSQMQKVNLPASVDGLNIVVVHCAPRTAVELTTLEDIFFPPHEMLGRDYDRVYCDMNPGYDVAGIDEHNRVVLVRPDQYVSWCGGLVNVKGLRDQLDQIFIGR